MPRFVIAVHGNNFISEQFAPGIGPVSTQGIDPHGGRIAAPAAAASVLDQGVPRGWGRSFTQPGWYHIAIPVITSHAGSSMNIEEVLILCSGEHSRILEAHFWNAGSILWREFLTPPRLWNLVFHPPSNLSPYEITSGLGVSLRADIEAPGYVLFTSASAAISTRS